MSSQLYPKSPELTSYDFIKPSPKFVDSATHVVFAIVIFLFFYLLLIAIATSVMIGSGWLAMAILSWHANIFTVAAAAGIFALGVMLFLFLFKFVYSSAKDVNPNRFEIKESVHPELFQFIKSLTNDTKSKQPKRIFVSPEVNAMVFYNSSFWSLFFPIRKNLEIGLGLVNTLNISEFKAVLAHEFGHFSQRSMKIGSYIYTVNKVIYNLVYEYDSWDQTLSSWSGAGGIFGAFSGVTFWIVERIRSLLKAAYNLINVAYMKLSREMEYHADLVAVSVGGNNSLVNALKKTEFSSFAYDYTTGFLDSLANNGKASKNIYANHSFTLSFLAKLNNIQDSNGDIKIDDLDDPAILKSRVMIKDQWASHPTLKERIENISKVTIDTVDNSESAWKLFSHYETLQEQVTKMIYENGFKGVEFELIENNAFKDHASNELNKYKISDSYNGFYDDRYLTTFELRELIRKGTNKTFDNIYSKDNVEKIKRLGLNKIDLEILKQINSKLIKVKFFEFDGEKYTAKEAGKLIPGVQSEVEKGEKFIEEMDKESFTYHHSKAKDASKDAKLVDLYQTYFHLVGVLGSLDDRNAEMQKLSDKLYTQVRFAEEEVRQLAAEFSSVEKKYKDFLKAQDLNKIIENVESEDQAKALKEFVEGDKFYSRLNDFHEQNFIDFSNLMMEVNYSLGIQYGNMLKELTDFQLQFVPNSKH